MIGVGRKFNLLKRVVYYDYVNKFFNEMFIFLKLEWVIFGVFGNLINFILLGDIIFVGFLCYFWWIF